MENILIRTVYGNSGELKDLCNNCNKTFENFLIDLINLKGNSFYMLSDKALDVLIRSGWYEGRKIDIKETISF